MKTFTYKNIDYNISSLYETDLIYKYISGVKTFYEIKLLEKISQLNLQGIFIDVGSNIGNHTLFFANHCDSTEVYSYEIHPKIFSVLEKNIKTNVINSSKCHLFNCGISNKEEKVSLSEIHPSNTGMTKIIKGPGIYKVDTLDKLLEDIDNIVLIKIDVEGHELSVLEGAHNILKNHKPIIVAECSPEAKFKEVNDFLVNYGYYSDKINLAHTPTYLWS